MMLKVVAVFDIAAQCFQRPLFVPALGAATRWFEDHCKRNDRDDPMCLHPDHFQLFELGSFDDFDGRFVILDKPQLVMHGSVLKE